MPAACATASAPATCAPIAAARCQGSRPSLAISALSEGPVMKRMTIHGASSCSTTL